MSRVLSNNPSAIRSRERRLDAAIEKQEQEFNASVHDFMGKGMTFDEAWIAAGGMIIPDKTGIKA